VGFDPDAYLADQSQTQDSGSFDPDAYLASTSQNTSGSYPLNYGRVGLAALGLAQDKAPWNKANAAYKRGIGSYAEWLGKHTSLEPAKIASATLPLAMAPELLGAITSWEGIHNTTNPTVKGLVNSPQELGPQYEAQNEAIGVTRRTPQEGGAKPAYPEPYQYPSQLTKMKPTKFIKGVPGPLEDTGQTIPRLKPQIPAESLPSTVPIRYPSKPGDFMTYANNRLQFGSQLDPQELMDWQVKLQTDMSNGAIPKFDPNGKITTVFQQASDLKSRIGNVFNQIAEPRLVGADLPEGTIPTRSGLNQAYGVSSKQQTVQNALKKTGKIARYAGELGAAGYGAYQGAKKLLSQ